MRFLAFALLLAVSARAGEPARLIVLHTNDLHGQLDPLPKSPVRPVLRGRRAGGLAHLATMVRAIRKEAADTGAHVLLLDGGDLFQGTAVGNETRGTAVLDVMKEIGYDAAAVGNHEFDYGLENCLRLAKASAFPLLCANASGTSRPLDGISSHVVFDAPRFPCRVAVIGLITPKTPWITTPGIEKHVKFADPIPVARSLLGATDADLKILLTHIGRDGDAELARACPGVDLIVGGHSHTGMGETVNGVPIVQTHGKGMTLGRVDLDLERGSWKVLRVSYRLIPVDPDATPPDAVVGERIRIHTHATRKKLARKIGRLTAPLRRTRDFGASSAGNWMADVIRDATGAEIGFMNKGGIRCDLEAGPITAADVYRIMPFDNTVVSMDLTGAQVRSIVRQALRPGRRYPGLDWSGILVDADREGTGIRPTRILVAGAELKDEAKYRVATNSFLGAGGDGFAQFKAGTAVTRHKTLLRDALTSHLETRTPYTPPSEDRLRVSESASR